MRIALLCATGRGLRFLQKLIALQPDAELVVFSFREDAHEPPFLDAIRDTAGSAGAHFIETKNVASDKWRDFWDSTPLDLMLAVSWRYLIPAQIYQRPRRGTYIFHDSLLPAYRGFAPTVWALLNGAAQTGVTLFEIADAVDSGPIVGQLPVAIRPDDTIATVMDNVTAAYLHLLETHLSALLDGTAVKTPQDHRQATFTCRRLPADNRIDWTGPTERIYNLIRAVTRPYPGAFTTLNGEKLTVWGARRLPDFPPYIGRVPGRVVQHGDEGAIVLTGDGALLLTEVQLGDNEPVHAATVLNSLSLTLGR